MLDINSSNSTKLNNAAEEAYRILRANLDFYGMVKSLKTVTITSYGPNEGKTTTCINLSISITKLDKKVLYVDADMRKPMLMKNFGSSDLKGLSNYLSGHSELKDIIHGTDINGFFYIPCGAKPFNATELLNTKRFDTLLNDVRNQFDMVIIDTPPLGSVIDAASIAAKTDGTLIVIKPGSVKYKNGLMMKEQLQKANARILGVVLNGVDRINYREYYGSYDYYGSKRKYAKAWFKNLKGSKKTKG